MSFVNTFVELPKEGEMSPAEEYTTADDPIQPESMYHKEEYGSDGEEFDKVLNSLVESKMKDQNSIETVKVATVGSADQLESENLFESAAMKPELLVEMLQSMASPNSTPIDLRSKENLLSVDPKVKGVVVQLPEIDENFFQMPPSLESTHTMEVPALWNTNDDDGDDDSDNDPLVSMPRKTELCVIDKNCIETPTYMLYTYTSDRHASFDATMVADYANNVRPIYRQFYEAQADLEDLCEDNRTFLEMQSNRSDKSTEGMQTQTTLKRPSRWSPVAEQSNFHNKSMDAMSCERSNDTVPAIQQEVANKAAPSVVPIMKPPRDPRLRLSAPTYKNFNQTCTSIPPPQLMSPVNNNAMQPPQLPPLLSPAAALSSLPPLTLLASLPPIQHTQLRALFSTPPPVLPIPQLPSNSPIMNGPTTQRTPITIPTAQQLKPGKNATSTVPTQMDNFKEKANSFKNYREYRRYMESIESSSTDTVTTMTKPNQINLKIQKANEQLFGTGDLSDGNRKSTDRTTDQKKVSMASLPLQSKDKQTEIISKNSESKIDAAEPLINQTDDSMSMGATDQGKS